MKRSICTLPAPFPIVAIVGPTAVGKTTLTLRLAGEINAEIINVDSVQVYRWLDIGSAKPAPEEMRCVRHHLVNIRYPFEPFDAADFVQAARLAAGHVLSRGRTVVLSGGTGLYLNAFLDGLAPCSGAHPCLREMLKKFAERYGADRLHEVLAGYDPEAASRLHVNDIFRVVRALEVVLATGMPLSMWHRMHHGGSRTGLAGKPCIVAGLIRSREELYQRIDRRVDIMMAQGFVEEVERILASGCSPMLKPLQSLGYRHIIRFLSGDAGLEETVTEIKRDTRRYAKRQLTWFRAQARIQWFHPQQLMEAPSVWKEIARRCAAV